MTFKRVFRKLGRHKKDGSESREGSSWPDTPTPEARIRSASPRPMQSSAIPALVPRLSAHLQTPPPVESRNIETPSTNHDPWTNLTAFLDIIKHTPIFSPLTTAIDNLSWFIRAHENVITTWDEYDTLRTQLEAQFNDLIDHFSGDTPPAMTTSMLNLCVAIQGELTRVYGTQDRNTISRYMQADQDLEKVTGCYRRIQIHLERLTNAQLDRINPSMSASYDSAEANVVQRRECAPRTREQVLLDLESWKNNPDGEKVCWINGMAGTGKTTIATSLCSTLNKSHELGASFFCTRSIPTCRNINLILPTIAYQLARFSSPFRGALLQVLDRDPDVHTKVPRVQFQRMILEPLQAVLRSLPNIVVAVDALDECDDGDGAEQILEVLLENSSALPIKFLISSRPEQHIRERIGKWAAKKQLILHELDQRMVKADIETYLRAELASMSTPITNDQLATLVGRAGALFIYAATVVRYIKRGNTAERLATVLGVSSLGRGVNTQTRDIDRLYETVLISAFDNEDLEQSEKERMRLLLHTVVCAQEPLTLNALAGLLGLSLIQVSDALNPLWSVLYLSESDPTHRVSTLHASFPDYMLDPDRAKRFACNAAIHNGKLAELCFTRIRRNIPQFNICGLQTSYVPDRDVRDLSERVSQNIPLDLLYACQYWAVHLSQAGKQNERATALHEFLSRRLLLWIEVLNLNKRINQAVGQIEMTIPWLEATELSEKTISLARDALRFVTMFAASPVSQSTPHLYASMLSLWPHSQPISKCYAQKTIGLVEPKGIDTTERQLSLLSLIPVGSQIYSLSYSPSGAFFASGTYKHEVLVWDAMSCRMTIDPISGHTGVVQTIAISPDGTQICSGSRDQTLRIWEPQTGRLLAGPLVGHTDWIYSVGYSPNGQSLASGSSDGTVRIWDTSNWDVNGDPLDGNNGSVFSVAFSPDSAILAAGSESLIHLWDHLRGQLRGEPLKGHTHDINTLAFTPDGKHLISGSDDNTIRIWDVGTGQMTFGPLQENLSAIDHITVSPNGKLVASAARDNTIRIWDTNSWTTRSLFRDTGIAKSVAFSPDGSRLLSGSVDRNIRVWEVPYESDEKAVENQSEGHDDSIKSIAFSPDGTYIVSGSYDMTVRIWDAQNGQPVGNPLIGHKNWVTQVGISTDGNHIFSVSSDRMIHVWDSKTGQLEYASGPIETDDDYDPYYLENWPAIFIFDARRAICGSKSGPIYVREKNKLIHELAGHGAQVRSITSSPDGQTFVSGDDDGKVIVWDASSGEKMQGPFRAHSGCIYAVALSPDGILIASGSLDKTIRLWNAPTGSLAGEILRGHTDAVRYVAFSHQSELLVSGSTDHTVHVWNVASGRSVAVFEGHTDMVRSVAFSPDGTHIASGSSDMTIRVWNTPMSTDASDDDECNNQAGESTSIAENNCTLNWTMNETGWVQDSERRLLVWVPADLRSTLLRSQNTMLISRQGCVELDFSSARIGETWATCYEPFPPVTGSEIVAAII